MNNSIKIHENDNVCIALKPIKKGTIIDGIEILDDIAQGHKYSCEKIKEADFIIKYNSIMGKSTKDIFIGQHVHVHNTATTLDSIENYSYDPTFEDFSIFEKDYVINVYERKFGKIGIRNELWIIPTVGCVNAQSRNMIKEFERNTNIDKIDGVFTFPHQYGCSQMGDDHENTKLALQDIAKHPNAGGVLVVGLGCENNQLKSFKESLGEYDESRFRFLVLQEVEDEIEAGVSLLNELYEIMSNDIRLPHHISELNIGLECGGSDGFSGITANPVVGRVSDYIVKNGGTSVLTEVPEMFGAEKALMKRAINEDIFLKTVQMINGFKNYYKSHNQVVYDNPSPGNKSGGITTLEDKSLGCIQKAGRSEIVDVLQYGELLKTKGLNLLSSPGNDIVATTALGMAGCHLVLFTTGRGTPFGGFIPTIKISTNSELAQKKKNWIDFDAGSLIINGNMDQIAESLMDLVVDVVNGKHTKNEINDFREIAIFKSGVTL